MHRSSQKVNGLRSLRKLKIMILAFHITLIEPLDNVLLAMNYLFSVNISVTISA